MKRSEMVRRMAEFWVGLIPGQNPQNVNLDPDDFEEIKDRMGDLLYMLEYKGMLPPLESGTGFFIPEVARSEKKNTWEEE